MYKYRFSCVEDLTKIYVEEKVKFLFNIDKSGYAESES